MQKNKINIATLQFLKKLAANNNRDWFNANKDNYLEAHKNMCAFIDVLIAEMNKHDKLEDESGRKSLFRIYNDVRFSKDKSPYNPRFAFSLSRATRLRRGGYYVNIKPGNNFVACGFFGPNPEDLKRIRIDIEHHYKDWNKILASKNIRQNFGKLQGNTVATVPRGYSVEHPAIELLRHKQFILRHNFTDKEVLSNDFLKDINGILKSVRPFFNYMSEVLTTNANGETVI